MLISDYEELPETVSVGEVSRLFRIFLDEEPEDSNETKFAKLSIISEKQWHTYSHQDDETKGLVAAWIERNWVRSSQFLDCAIGLIYAFGLGKDLFVRALSVYEGEGETEYREMLDRSKGSDIDPYWSLNRPGFPGDSIS